ncbi:putative reverse transcriptase, RNA-dependent DNA polymerase [Tanacetum coccineum]
MPDLEDDSDVFPNDGIFSGAYDDEDVSREVDFNNMDNIINVSPIPTLRVHNDYPKGQILGDPKSAVQTRGKIQKASSIQQALFKLQKVWILLDLPFEKKAIGTKWVFGNKRDERSIVVKNKARLVAQGFREEEGINYDEVFAPVARIEAIMLFLAFASFMGFHVYQMDVKSVIKALYGLHQALGAWYETLSSFLLENGFMRATTPIESNKPLVKDEDGLDVDVHVYKSMIGSLMYWTTSRPDIMFVVCACARFQVTPKASHLNAVKRIFRYFKHQPKLGLWYPKDSPFELEAFSNSDYKGASLDRKSTTGGCQFLGRRLISWQCKKQTIMANYTTEAEYVAAANCFGQVLWIQNQMMDYGFNFITTKIHINNQSTICIVKNPVYHSRTKHIEIRHHFIKDCYEKRLIDVIKIYTDANVANLLTKGFNVTRFNFLVYFLVFTTSIDLRMDGSCASSFSHIWSMTVGAELKMPIFRYSNKHDMVAFLKKPTESVGFTEIVDFLKDNKEYTITKASIRSQLQWADTTGIINLSDAKIYEGLATLGPKSGGWDQFGSTIATALICLSSNRVQLRIKDTEVPQPQGPTITLVADKATTTNVRVETEGAATTTFGLDAGMDSGNIHESPLRSYEAPLSEGNTSGSAEDSLQLKELMVIVPKMVTKIDSLEKELKEIKQTLGNAVLTLVKKVKSLKVALKRMSKRVILSDLEDEETENHGRKIQDIDDDPLVSLVRESIKEKEADFVTHAKASASGETQEEDISPIVLEAAQTLSQVVSQSVSTYKRRAKSANKGKEIGTGLDFFSAAKERLHSAEVEVNTKVNSGSAGVYTGNTPVSTPSVIKNTIPSPVKGQREGKAPMIAKDVQATQKTKAQIEQEKVGLVEAMRLQDLQDEEATRQVHLDALLAKRIQEEQKLSEQQQKRKAQFHEAAQHYTEEDWDNIRAKLEANTELVKDMLGETMSSEDYAKRMNQGTWKVTQLKKLTFAELKEEFKKLVRSIESSVPKDAEIEKTRVKRTGIEIQTETSKKQKISIEDVPITEDKVEVEEREAHMKDKVTDSSSDFDIGRDAILTATKPPSVVDWKIIPQPGQKVVLALKYGD